MELSFGAFSVGSSSVTSDSSKIEIAFDALSTGSPSIMTDNLPVSRQICLSQRQCPLMDYKLSNVLEEGGACGGHVAYDMF